MIKRALTLILVTALLTSCAFVPKDKLEAEPNIPGSHGEKLEETDPATETPDCSIIDPVIAETDPVESDIYETEQEEPPSPETDKPVDSPDIPYLSVPAADDVNDAVTVFSEVIYKNIISHSEKYENVIFSPISVIYALSLTGNGALDETYGEFADLFGGIGPKELNGYLGDLDSQLSSTEKSIVKIGNAIWVNGESGESSLSDDYLLVADRYYSAKVEELPFDETAEELMNEWVKEKTNGMIDKAVENLDPDLVMLLMNTVLFDGKWSESFEEERTVDGIFYNYDGTESTASYMRSTEMYSYISLEGAEGIYKYYSDGYKFIAILPEGDINEFISGMDIGEIIKKSGYGDTTEIKLSLPRFEYKSSVNLNEILAGMGLKRAFSGDAQFGGLFKDDGRSVYISNVSQKAKIIMNESGTKAAAYTEVEMPECEFNYVELNFNRPFFYMIIDKDGTPLFLGTIYTFAEE